ncbi:MAG: thioredoxin family protein [Deltaproteobacteria bacterium]|nr:thioredoxin family protein [Deltaproteobacteria bacterium]
MKIQILGSGCAKCKRLEELVRQAADNLGLTYEIEKIDKVPDILKMGVMITPGLAIDNKVILSGRLPSLSELTSIITSYLAKNS